MPWAWRWPGYPEALDLTPEEAAEVYLLEQPPADTHWGDKTP
jgi:hypothetical protein